MRAKNKEFDKIRMEIIGLLNSYSWTDKVIDNTEEVKKGVRICLEHYLHNSRDKYETYKERGLTIQAIQYEAEVGIVQDILDNFEDWL